MNRFIANGARRIDDQVAAVEAGSRMSVDVLVVSRPARFECFDEEIPRIKSVIYNAGFFLR